MKSAHVFSLLLTTLTLGSGLLSNAPLRADDADNMRVNAPISCSIQTYNGRYVTAVGGGGRTTDVLHTDAVKPSTWERFILIDTGVGSPIQYGFKTYRGTYLTAVGGGGRITDVIHSDATTIAAWEKFTLNALGNGYFAIQTSNGHYLTATGAGGQVVDAIHSDATKIGTWEMFRFNCKNI